MAIGDRFVHAKLCYIAERCTLMTSSHELSVPIGPHISSVRSNKHQDLSSCQYKYVYSVRLSSSAGDVVGQSQKPLSSVCHRRDFPTN